MSREINPSRSAISSWVDDDNFSLILAMALTQTVRTITPIKRNLFITVKQRLMLIISVDDKVFFFPKLKSPQNYTFNYYSANKSHKTSNKNVQNTTITPAVPHMNTFHHSKKD
jgi:hypothetical protein